MWSPTRSVTPGSSFTTATETWPKKCVTVPMRSPGGGGGGGGAEGLAAFGFGFLRTLAAVLTTFLTTFLRTFRTGFVRRTFDFDFAFFALAMQTSRKLRSLSGARA